MVAKGLRRALAIQAIGMAICAYLLVRFAELSLAAAAVHSFAVLLGVYLLFTLATFAICWPRSRDDGPGQTSSLLAACRTIFTEWLAIFALFGVIQPFADSFFSVKGRSRRAEKLPVLQTSSRLSGAQDIVVTGMGHLTLVFSPLVLDIVVKELG